MKLSTFPALSVLAIALCGPPALALAQAGGAAPAAASKDSPGPWLRATVERAKKLAERKIKPDTPEEAAWRKEVQEAINDVIDWPELTQRALGKAWEGKTAKEREDFSKLLRQIVEASYEAKLRMAARGEVKEPAKIDIQWGEEKVTGDLATSAAKVKADKDNAAFEFAMKKTGDRWRIYDVTIDDVSTLRTYRSQFSKIIAEKGFPTLLERMQKKVDELKSGKGTLEPGAKTTVQ